MYGVEVSNGEVRAIAMLDDHNAWVIFMVKGLPARPSHLLDQDGAIELEETILWILE